MPQSKMIQQFRTAVAVGTPGIYSITNKANGKVYVGSAVHLGQRFSNHKSCLRHGEGVNQYLQNAWDKYGEENFEFKVLVYCSKESLLLWEQIAIDGHISQLGWDNLYNLSPTAASPLGLKHTEEFKEWPQGRKSGGKADA